MCTTNIKLKYPVPLIIKNDPEEYLLKWRTGCGYILSLSVHSVPVKDPECEALFSNKSNRFDNLTNQWLINKNRYSEFFFKLNRVFLCSLSIPFIFIEDDFYTAIEEMLK